jgi:hypothetical protein
MNKDTGKRANSSKKDPKSEDKSEDEEPVNFPSKRSTASLWTDGKFTPPPYISPYEPRRVIVSSPAEQQDSEPVHFRELRVTKFRNDDNRVIFYPDDSSDEEFDKFMVLEEKNAKVRQMAVNAYMAPYEKALAEAEEKQYDSKEDAEKWQQANDAKHLAIMEYGARMGLE